MRLWLRRVDEVWCYLCGLGGLPWLGSTFEISALALRDLGLRDATDREIFLAARREGATVVTKEGDFVRLLEDLGPPPQVIWITCDNTSNANLKRIRQTRCLEHSSSCSSVRRLWK